MNSKSKATLRIMLIEDSPFDFELIQEQLRAELDCQIVAVTSHLILLNELDTALPDVIIADSNVPRINGITVLEFIQKVHPQIPFIFCSGNSSPDLRGTALSRGAKAWVSKNDLPRLIEEIKRVREGANHQ